MRKKMRCNVCKHNTNWDESYGYPSFIVCPLCMNKLTQVLSWDKAMAAIFTIGSIKQEKKRDD